ncbi:CAP domain-containing protein [Halorussus ruber]|uniref:CAP domain-containing protein n=1 Tax=Halorussus ruber TaxID=1126238 RepID=UPI001092C1F0|nr:CAP domain-containing protein [Halorussus ruber]
MEWMCAECGAPHPKNNPPCKNCGAMQFEKTVVRQRPEDDPVSVEWECTECGRTHPKNSPPCSRCGNMQLESVEANQFDEDELSGGLGLFDVAKFVGALAIVALVLFAAFSTGILDQTQPPTVENVPGEANESSGLDLSTVEYHVYERLNGERSAEAVETLSLKPDVTTIADYYTKSMVKRGEYPLDESSKEIFERFGSCADPSLTYNRIGYETVSEERAIEHYTSETELANALADSWLQDSGTRPILLDRTSSSVGIDVHVAENGDIYATVAFC